RAMLVVRLLPVGGGLLRSARITKAGLAQRVADPEVVPQPQEEHRDHPRQEGDEDQQDQRHPVELSETEVHDHPLPTIERGEQRGEDADRGECAPAAPPRLRHATRCAASPPTREPTKVAPVVSSSRTWTNWPISD